MTSKSKQLENQEPEIDYEDMLLKRFRIKGGHYLMVTKTKKTTKKTKKKPAKKKTSSKKKTVK